MTRRAARSTDAGEALPADVDDLGGIARAPDGTVWVLDRSPGAAGVRVYSAAGMAVTTMPLSTGTLPPYGVAFVP